jgi:glycine oxidase
VGSDKRTSAAAIADLLALALRLVPGLKGAEIEQTWAGLRPGSMDGLPTLGPVPGWENVWVGSGHFRAGLQLSTGSALLLKEMLLGEKTSLDAAPFRVGRGALEGKTE